MTKFTHPTTQEEKTMSGMFIELEGETAILAVGGAYKEGPRTVRNNGQMFAKAFGGFVRLKYDGATSKSTARLDTLTIGNLWRDRMGNLCAHDAADRVVVTSDAARAYLPQLQQG